jgi:hypothetical protein
MSAPTVRQQPTVFNTFRLDGDLSPGVSTIGGGEAEEEIQDQRQPLTTGANSVVQFSKNAVLVYTLTLWEDADLRKWEDQWEPMFLAGRAKRPVRVYKLSDRRVTWVKQVIFQKMTPQGIDKPGGPWTRVLTLHQYNRVAPYGGPVKPGFLDAEIKAANQANTAKQAQLDALNKQVSSIPGGKK